jgi:uncharacterized membrane protein
MKHNLISFKCDTLVVLMMRRVITGAIIAFVVAAGVTALSSVILGYPYGTTQRELYLQIENTLELIVPQTLDNAIQSQSYILTYDDNENLENKSLDWSNLSWQQNVKLGRSGDVLGFALNSVDQQMSQVYASQISELENSDYVLALQSAQSSQEAPFSPALGDAYSGYSETTQDIENITNMSFLVRETQPVNVLPIASSIGIAMGVTVFAIWIGYRRNWGEATHTLLEQGLHDMTVRDVEIVGYIMQQGEFTIPELTKMSKASKVTVWRTVQRLVNQGIVKTTDQTKPASSGLGGRGKPSQVYKYVSKPKTPAPKFNPLKKPEPET